MDLLTGLRTAASLWAFMKSNELIEALGELELIAAKNAIENLEYARDRRGQIWSCIGHLETAEVALNERSLFTGSQWIRNQHTLNFTIGLIATCYRDLGEERLKERALERLIRNDKALDLAVKTGITPFGPLRIHDVIGSLVFGPPKHRVGCVFCLRDELRGQHGGCAAH